MTTQTEQLVALEVPALREAAQSGLPLWHSIDTVQNAALAAGIVTEQDLSGTNPNRAGIDWLPVTEGKLAELEIVLPRR